MRATVERNVNTEFGPRIKKLLLLGVLPHRMNEGPVRNSIRNRSPGLAQIGGFENIGLKIVELVAIDSCVGSLAVTWRSFNQIDCAPFRHFWADVSPMGAVIGRDLDQSVIRARPQGAFVDWRFGQREN